MRENYATCNYCLDAIKYLAKRHNPLSHLLIDLINESTNFSLVYFDNSSLSYIITMVLMPIVKIELLI